MSQNEADRLKEQEVVSTENKVLVEDDDEPDEWDQRINKTGCADENMKLTDCYWDKKDWRQCKDEMKAFQDCWKRNGNVERTS